VCGLSGTYAPDGRLDRGVPVALHDRVGHRGPDETYSLDTLTLSAKLARLGMTGLADGWQPAQERSGRFVALTNGEVFNTRELWAELGAEPVNGADVAVVPELIKRYGVDGLARIDGQFATVVLDQSANVLYLARDRFGICPLYFAVVGGRVHFCSELKPLVNVLDVAWRIDLGAVDQYLALGNIVAPRTVVGGVRAVEPGCAVRFAGGGQRSLRYWRYGSGFGAGGPVPEEELREGLRGAVAARLDADVEIGAYLSGGFDSSALLMEAAGLSGRPVRSFSVVFDDPALDEADYQHEVVAAAGSKHEEVVCRGADVAGRFEEMVRHCCVPQRETYNVPALMLSEKAHAAGIKGVVSGEGADELFFGYDSYAFDSAPHARRARSRPENEAAWGRADFGWEVDWAAAEARRAGYLSPAAREALLGQEFWRTRLIPFSDEETRALTPMQLRSVADVHVQLSGHLLGDHGDAMLMANSVEGRYPFLANPVVALAQRTPDAGKVEDFEGKAVLRAAYRGIVPDRVIDRAKHGFTAQSLHSAAGERRWSTWRDLVAASGILDPACLDGDSSHQGPHQGKWDFRLSAISLAMIVDELGLRL
jgi:asparagine synthase (glutamine-hydrolysing)